MPTKTQLQEGLLENVTELPTEEFLEIMQKASTDDQTYSLFILNVARLILVTAASATSAAISKQQHWQSNITEADAAKATSLGYFTLVVGVIIIVKLCYCSKLKKAGKFNSGLIPAALSGAIKGTLASLIGAAILKQDIPACISVSAAGSALAFGAIGLFASGGKMATVVDSQSKTGCGSSALRIVGS